MDEATLNALKLSIEHWKRLVSGNSGPDENIGVKSCALCSLFQRLFHRDLLEDQECVGCPVYTATGEQFCEKTPYTDVADFVLDEPKYKELPEFKRLAQLELDFLVSLLPPEEAK